MGTRSDEGTPRGYCSTVTANLSGSIAALRGLALDDFNRCRCTNSVRPRFDHLMGISAISDAARCVTPISAPTTLRISVTSSMCPPPNPVLVLTNAALADFDKAHAITFSSSVNFEVSRITFTPTGRQHLRRLEYLRERARNLHSLGHQYLGPYQLRARTVRPLSSRMPSIEGSLLREENPPQHRLAPDCPSRAVSSIGR